MGSSQTLSDSEFAKAMYLQKFVRAWWADWTVRMTGPLSIGLLVWAAFFPPSAERLRWLVTGMAAICFVLGSYSIWASQHKKVIALESVNKQNRPRLVGFFQDFVAHGWTKRGTGDEGEVPQAMGSRPLEPTGTLVMIQIAFVNESQIHTTLHDFSLVIRVGDRTFFARHPEELPSPPGDSLPPRFLAEAGKKYEASLMHFLDDPSKVAVQGRRIQGSLSFYFERFTWEELKDQDWVFTLGISDAWGEKHEIVHWGERPRPSQRVL